MKKNSFSSRKFRGGAYATVVSLLVFAVILIINLLATNVNRLIDLTATKTYSLTEETLAYLEGITSPIELYYISEAGEESLVLSRTAELFAEHGENVTLTYKDPVQYPGFVYQYNGVSEIHNNSILVMNADDPERYAYIDHEEMCIYSLDKNDYTKKTLTGYDAEMEIVKAMVSVTDSGNQSIYFTAGHGEFLINPNTREPEVSTALNDLLQLNSYTAKYVNLATVTELPRDCNVLCIGGATTDLSEEEVVLLKDFITGGGNLIVLLYYTGQPLPQLQSLMKAYGMEMQVGLLNEGDSAYTIQGNSNYILTKYDGRNVQWALCTGVTKQNELRDTLTVESLYSTTASAYLKEDLNNQAWEEGIPRQTYSLLTKATETYAGNTGSVQVYASCFFLADVCIEGSSSYNNRQLFLSELGKLTGGGSALTIPNASAFEEGLTMTTKEKNRVAAISIGIPAVFLILGGIVVFRRRA